MAVIDARGFQLTPDVLGAAGRGLKLGEQFRAVGRQNEAFDREAQIRQLLGEATQPATEQQQMLSAESFPGEAAAELAGPTQEQKIQQARKIDPAIAKKMLSDAGLDDTTRRAEMSRFATQLQAAAPERRADMINARAQSLQSQGRDPVDTLELLDMSPEEQNQALKAFELIDLSTKDKLTLQQQKAKASSTAAGFQDIERRGDKLFGINKATGQLQEIPATPGASVALQEQVIAEEEAKAAKDLAEKQKTTFNQTQSLRKEFEAKIKPQEQIVNSFGTFQALKSADKELINEFKQNLNAFADKTVDKQRLLQDAQALTDVATIFAFFKIVDPTSTVREGEFATVESSGGVETRFRNTYNRLLKGGRLNDAQRQQIFRIAENKHKAAQKKIDNQQRKFRFSAEKQKIDPELVIIPDQVAPPPPAGFVIEGQ